MDSIWLFFNAASQAFNPTVLVLIVVATALGAIIGALPGFSSVMAISLLLPIVYPMDPLMGLSLLGAIYMGAMYGDANAAILLNIPGTASALPTTFDGFPMTQQGRAREALLAALLGSAFGGAFGVITLMLSFGLLAQLSLMFGPQEYFWLTVLGLTSIAALSSSNVIKGLLGGAIGITITFIGLDPYWGMPRFTLSQPILNQGVGLIPALLGLFCVAQLLVMAEQRSAKIGDAEIGTQNDALKIVLRNMRERWDVLLRSSIIGVVIGALPGAGGPIASTVSYNETRRWDKNPEKYGKGAIEGVFASEVANNAMVGGSLIPMMALGIPGNVNAAVILGALLAFGLRPGMELATDPSGVAVAFMVGLLIASLVIVPVGYFFIMRISISVLKVPVSILIPTILIFASVGAYSVTNSMFGVYVLVAMALLGYLLRKVGIDAAPVGLGLILGPIAEREFSSSLAIASATSDYLTLFLRPISLVLITLCLTSVVGPLLVKPKPKLHDIKGETE